jgi:hypothetical protein
MASMASDSASSKSSCSLVHAAGVATTKPYAHFSISSAETTKILSSHRRRTEAEPTKAKRPSHDGVAPCGKARAGKPGGGRRR